VEWYRRTDQEVPWWRRRVPARRGQRRAPCKRTNTGSGPSSGGGRRIPLADLQAQGFNTTPPPGFAPGGLIRPDYRGFGISAADVFQKLTDLPTINVKTWLPGDDEAGS